ncbi:protein diaphanous homolog 1-like [Cydia fagiglandana]|uniref:protein diaphanous homolog 1-like n=1 Tax=Cydia fagiglandana TaxID=1458189 RepID=UPI002FEDFCFB
MTTRRDVLVAKMQQLQKELKTAEELNKRLLQEQEESAEQFEQVVRINTTLKSQLANQDVEFEDMQGQRDELQAAVDQFKNCQEIHEQALQRIQDLEQQLEESESKHSCKYCSGHSGLRDNNLSIFAEINSFDVDSVDDSIGFSPMVETVDLKSSVHIEGSSDIRVALKGSKKIKKYLKLSRFIKKSKLLLKRHNSIFKTIQSKCNSVALSDELLNCQYQLDRTVEELSHRSDELEKLELKLKNLNNRDELSSKALQEYIAFMNNVLEPGSGYTLRMDSPRPPPRPATPDSPALRAALAAPGSPALRAALAAPGSPALRAALAAPGSPALRALFASRAARAPELRGDSAPAPRVADPAPPPPSSPPSRAERVPSGPGRAEPTPSLPCLVEPAPSPPSLVKLALSLLTYVEPAPSPPSPVSPAPSPLGLPSPAPAPPRLGSGAAPPPPPRRPRAAGRRTLLYSDEVGAGLGVLLAQRLSQGVVNHCHPGASVDRLIESISAGEFDRDSTLSIPGPWAAQQEDVLSDAPDRWCGRPRYRWCDMVEADLLELRVNN